MASVSFRIDDQTKARLDRLSETRNLNPSAVFRQVLDEALNELEFGKVSGKALSLSLSDRLKLATQYEILKELKPQDAEKYEASIEILKSGFEIHYRHLVADFQEGLSDSGCAEVLQILDMHAVLRNFLNTHAHAGSIEWNKFGRFVGFDEQTEREQYLFAKYLIFDLGHYKLIADDVYRNGLSSVHPMLPRYRKMLDAWLTCGNIFNPEPDEAHEIIMAGISE